MENFDFSFKKKKVSQKLKNFGLEMTPRSCNSGVLCLHSPSWVWFPSRSHLPWYTVVWCIMVHIVQPGSPAHRGGGHDAIKHLWGTSPAFPNQHLSFLRWKISVSNFGVWPKNFWFSIFHLKVKIFPPEKKIISQQVLVPTFNYLTWYKYLLWTTWFLSVIFSFQCNIS